MAKVGREIGKGISKCNRYNIGEGRERSGSGFGEVEKGGKSAWCEGAAMVGCEAEGAEGTFVGRGRVAGVMFPAIAGVVEGKTAHQGVAVGFGKN